MKLLPSHKRLLILVILLALVVSVASAKHDDKAGAAPAQAVPAEVTQIPEDKTRAVQLVLYSFGYSIAVDGVYGPQTTKVVKSWQKSNGLLVDGIAGPITQESLGLTFQVAVRGAQKQVTPIVPPPPRSVEQMIRDIWPDDQEEKALRIAWRESGYQPGVTSSTGCCHGIFQIHEVHFSWMKNFGVTTVAQLFDAETNIRMAYELYKRNGWTPWNL
jgi:peptidoglycan hydrolase-like protein with peptidoglycan-binding domain